MRLVINCSGLTSKGGIQVALSFIKECTYSLNNEYHIFITSEILDQIRIQDYSNQFHFHLIQFSPSSLRHSFRIIKQLKKLESELKPDCVFTVFGPSYWTPRAPHLIGYAIPHYIYPEYFKNAEVSLFYRYSFLVKKQLHKYFFKRNADFYYTETNDVSKKLSQLLKIPENNIFTIGNTYSHVFDNPVINQNLLPAREINEFRLITISGYYPHKNLMIIKKIIPILKKSDINVRFILTLPNQIFNKDFYKFEDTIINVGPVPLSHCPYLYSNSDALFLPTLLECFSASYPEAMKMKIPILTSDLSFAHSICGNAAEYFDPLNPEDIASKIITLAKDKNRQSELIRNGEKRILDFETSKSRAQKILEICENISIQNKQVSQ